MLLLPFKVVATPHMSATNCGQPVRSAGWPLIITERDRYKFSFDLKLLKGSLLYNPRETCSCQGRVADDQISSINIEIPKA